MNISNVDGRNTCNAQMKNGRTCGRNAHHLCNRQWVCGIHKTDIDDRLVLCRYKPFGLHLVDIDNQICEEEEDETFKIRNLEGYINIRAGGPLFANPEEYIPLVYMSKVSLGKPHFTKVEIAKELAGSIEYMLTRPDVYQLGIVSIAELMLDSITYDYDRGIFVANLRKIQ